MVNIYAWLGKGHCLLVYSLGFCLSLLCFSIICMQNAWSRLTALILFPTGGFILSFYSRSSIDIGSIRSTDGKKKHFVNVSSRILRIRKDIRPIWRDCHWKSDNYKLKEWMEWKGRLFFLYYLLFIIIFYSSLLPL